MHCNCCCVLKNSESLGSLTLPKTKFCSTAAVLGINVEDIKPISINLSPSWLSICPLVPVNSPPFRFLSEGNIVDDKGTFEFVERNSFELKILTGDKFDEDLGSSLYDMLSSFLRFVFFS